MSESSKDNTVSRRQFLQTSAVAAASTAISPATAAQALAQVTTATTGFAPSTLLGALFGGAWGTYDASLDMEDNASMRNLARSLANVILKSRKANQPAQALDDAKSHLMQTLYKTGQEIGALVAQQTANYDGIGRIVRQFEANPDSNNETRVLGAVLAEMHHYQDELNKQAGIVLQAALDKGHIIEQFPAAKTPEEAQRHREQWASILPHERLNNLTCSILDKDADSVSGADTPRYVFAKKVSHHKREALANRYYDAYETACEHLEGTVKLVKKLFGATGADVYDERDSLHDAFDTLMQMALDDTITPQTVIACFENPRTRFHNIAYHAYAEVSQLVKKGKTPYREEEMTAELQKILGKDFEQVLQAEFDKGFYEKITRDTPEEKPEVETKPTTVPDHTRSEKLSLKTAMDRVSKQDWSVRGSWGSSRGLG